MRHSITLLTASILTAFALATPPAAPITTQKGVVVCVSAPAADVGADILRRGGNAVDAAIAVAFAEAVTYPTAGNIGGGGFMLIHPAPGKGEPMVIDYRETAPAAATAEMFAKERDLYSAKAVGVPGTVAGLHLAFKKYGSRKLTWSELIQQAVKLAEEGFAIEAWTAQSLNEHLAKAEGNKEFQRAFSKPRGGPWQAGDQLRQSELGRSLRLIAEVGPDAFYRGPIADAIVVEMKRGNGLIDEIDLAKYQAIERKPVIGTYRGYEIISIPPPSAGGLVLIGMLNMLENFDVKALGRDTPEGQHLLAEVMRRAYLDRYRTLGDPAFVPIPDFFTSKDHAKKLASQIDLTKATPSASLATDIPLARDPDSTTHFSVIDSAGMAVSNTYTLEDRYGSRIVVRGGGFLLNNEMGDFNPQPGITKPSGQIGTAPNLIAPGKRMLSSLTPTIVRKDGKIILVTGSPGGRTITNTVLQVIVNTIDHGMDIQSAIDAPRMHHAAFPDEIKMEQVNRSALVENLKARDHKVVEHIQGDAHSIAIDANDVRKAGVDHRIMGKAAAE